MSASERSEEPAPLVLTTRTHCHCNSTAATTDEWRQCQSCMYVTSRFGCLTCRCRALVSPYAKADAVDRDCVHVIVCHTCGDYEHPECQPAGKLASADDWQCVACANGGGHARPEGDNHSYYPVPHYSVCVVCKKHYTDTKRFNAHLRLESAVKCRLRSAEMMQYARELWFCYCTGPKKCCGVYTKRKAMLQHRIKLATDSKRRSEAPASDDDDNNNAEKSTAASPPKKRKRRTAVVKEEEQEVEQPAPAISLKDAIAKVAPPDCEKLIDLCVNVLEENNIYTLGMLRAAHDDEFATLLEMCDIGTRVTLRAARALK